MQINRVSQGRLVSTTVCMTIVVVILFLRNSFYFLPYSSYTSNWARCTAISNGKKINAMRKSYPQRIRRAEKAFEGVK